MGAWAVLSRSRILGIAAALSAGLSVMVAQGAEAATPPSVTASIVGSAISLSSSSVGGAIGESFTVVNADHNVSLTLYDGTGEVETAPGYGCLGGCIIYFSGSGSPNTTTFTIKTFGVVTLQGPGVTSATLVIGPGVSAGGVDPVLVFPTAYLNPNKGTCTGTLQFTKMNGQNGTITTPDSAACTRSKYALEGWARTADATTSEFGPGKVVPIGDESFTLYAVWAPVKQYIEVTYDANVGALESCRDAHGDNVADVTTWTPRGIEVTQNNRTTTQTQSVGEEPNHNAICKPSWGVLAGWSTSPKDAVLAFSSKPPSGTVVGLQKSFADAWKTSDPPSKVTLYAMWTLPTVKLMESAVGTGGQAEIPWNSQLAMEPYTTPYGGMTCRAQQYVTTPPKDGHGVAYGSGNYFVATDLLGQPAPYTTVIVGAFGASLQFHGPGYVGMDTTAAEITVANGGWNTVETSPDGTTRSKIVGGAWQFDDMYNFQFPIYACPASPVTSPGGLGWLTVLTNNPASPLSWQFAQVTLTAKS